MTTCTLLQQRRALVKKAAVSNPISRLVECGQEIGHPVIFSSVAPPCSRTVWMWKVVWGDVMVKFGGDYKKSSKRNAAKKLIKHIVGNIQNESSSKVEEVDIIHISDSDQEEHGSNNTASTLDIGNTSGEIKRKEKRKKTGKTSKKGPKMYDQDLDPGKYNIVSVHVELLRSSQHSSTSLTQIGCVTYGSDDSFFSSIKPSCLEEYLDSYKLGGNLLQAVHMTREDDGTFLYRKRFEDIEEANKVVCVEESEALWSLRTYLQKYPNCVILGVDQETLAILADKIGFANLKKLNVVGFTYWKRVLEYLSVEDYNKVDLEDFSGESMASYTSALDIAKMLMKSVDEISSQKRSGKRSMKGKFYKLCKNIDFLSKPKEHVCENGYGDYIEVYNSFKPNLATMISVKKIEQVIITSESDFEPEETGSMDCQVDQASTNEKNTSLSSWIAGLSSKGLASQTQAPKISPSSKSDAKQSKEAEAISPRFAKVKSTPKLSQAALRASARSDQLKSTPLRRSSRLLKKSGPPTALGQTRKARSQTARPPPPADPPCAPAKAGPPVTSADPPRAPSCAPPPVSAGPLCSPSTASGGPSCAPKPVSTGASCAPSTAYASPPCAAPPDSAGPSYALITAPAATPSAPPPVSSGPPSTASIGPNLFFNDGPGLIHPNLDVFEGIPDNMLRSELESYITTNFYPVGRGGWGYVHCLWMYEDYQRAMVSQGRRVVLSPRVFTALVPELCEKHWGIISDESKSTYGPFGNCQFLFCFVGIVPKQK